MIGIFPPLVLAFIVAAVFSCAVAVGACVWALWDVNRRLRAKRQP